MIKIVETELAGRKLTLETGRLAKGAGGAVVVRYGDTMLLAAATASEKPRKGMDFFPLLVDFEEKLYAIGKIPGGFFKREGRPTEKAILTSRLIDRPIRPLFADGFRNDVQIVVTPLSVDIDNPPDILAVIGASAALTISNIPFQNPTGAVRIGKIDGEFIVNPTNAQIEISSMDLIVAGTADAIMMVEAGMEELDEEDVLKGIEIGHKAIKQVVKLQLDLASQLTIVKREFDLYKPDEKVKTFIVQNYKSKFDFALYIPDKDKRAEELRKIDKSIETSIGNCSDNNLVQVCNDNPGDVAAVTKKIQKEIMRKMIVESDVRIDGRKMDEIRTITCEIGILPRAHGSGLFTRGQTQVLTVATLGSKGEEQKIEGLEQEEWSKRYMHHYNFPAFSSGEVRPLRGPGRREIGHGALAERALMPVLPSEEQFPYTVRLVSEVLESNGSTSMASTCGSTLALMDAGVPISSPVAGIAMGLIKEGDKFKVLTDIAGIEDFLGDMDFKVTGTKKGITAIQMDIKIKGIDLNIMRIALEKAKIGRFLILEKMFKCIDTPRAQLSEFAPRVITIGIPVDKIGLVIGPGGKNIKAMIEEFKVSIDIEDDGRVFITGTDAAGAELAKKKIEDMTMEVEVGKVYIGKVVKIMPFGAFVEILPGKDGLVHISQISERRIAKVEDELHMGDEVKVKVLEIDDMGRINLSRKAALNL